MKILLIVAFSIMVISRILAAISHRKYARDSKKWHKWQEALKFAPVKENVEIMRKNTDNEKGVDNE